MRIVDDVESVPACCGTNLALDLVEDASAANHLHQRNPAIGLDLAAHQPVGQKLDHSHGVDHLSWAGSPARSQIEGGDLDDLLQCFGADAGSDMNDTTPLVAAVGWCAHTNNDQRLARWVKTRAERGAVSHHISPPTP